jgi:hypothetical protein
LNDPPKDNTPSGKKQGATFPYRETRTGMRKALALKPGPLKSDIAIAPVLYGYSLKALRDF